MNIYESSFCAIGDFPRKALNNTKLLDMVKHKYFKPIHAVIIPTNRCNLRCQFCCCKDRVYNEELSLGQIEYVLSELEKNGTKAITISGGGEPTIYPHFAEMVTSVLKHSMRIGLVTNGVKQQVLRELPMDSLEWCRISLGDGRNIEEVHGIIDCAEYMLEHKSVGLIGLSYVLTKKPNYTVIRELAKLVDGSSIKYLKFIIDETICDNYEYPEEIKKLDCQKKVLTPMVYSETTNTICFLNLIKPIFAADGYVYPCCEIQYNNENYELSYGKDRRIHTFEDYFANLPKQDGYYSEHCLKCFHSLLVNYLASTKSAYLHEDWI